MKKLLLLLLPLLASCSSKVTLEDCRYEFDENNNITVYKNDKPYDGMLYSKDGVAAFTIHKGNMDAAQIKHANGQIAMQMDLSYKGEETETEEVTDEGGEELGIQFEWVKEPYEPPTTYYNMQGKIISKESFTTQYPTLMQYLQDVDNIMLSRTY